MQARAEHRANDGVRKPQCSERCGHSWSVAIAETAERDERHAGLAAEARRLMQDPAYVREAREVAALMEELRGPG